MAEYSNSFSKQFREDQEEFLNIAIKKWKFHKNFKRNLIIFSLIGKVQKYIGIFLLVFAIIFLVFNLQIVEKEVYYSSQCAANQTNCEIKIEITSDMIQPIFIYYQLENFYRRNRNYFKSKSVEQLRGSINADISTCGDYQTNGEMGQTKSFGGNTLNSSASAFPCGEIAFTYFTDTFQLKNSSGQLVPIDETAIAWESDREYNFKNPTGWESFTWTNVENEHFMVWMRTAGQGRLKKLWGRIQSDVPKGSYTLLINNTYDETKYSSDAVKSFFITTTTVFGQKNMVFFCNNERFLLVHTLLGLSFVYAQQLCLLSYTIEIKEEKQFDLFQYQLQQSHMQADSFQNKFLAQQIKSKLNSKNHTTGYTLGSSVFTSKMKSEESIDKKLSMSQPMSPSYLKAMRALQDRIRTLEGENGILNEQIVKRYVSIQNVSSNYCPTAHIKSRQKNRVEKLLSTMTKNDIFRKEKEEDKDKEQLIKELDKKMRQSETENEDKIAHLHSDYRFQISQGEAKIRELNEEISNLQVQVFKQELHNQICKLKQMKVTRKNWHY